MMSSDVGLALEYLFFEQLVAVMHVASVSISATVSSQRSATRSSSAYDDTFSTGRALVACALPYTARSACPCTRKCVLKVILPYCLPHVIFNRYCGYIGSSSVSF